MLALPFLLLYIAPFTGLFRVNASVLLLVSAIVWLCDLVPMDLRHPNLPAGKILNSPWKIEPLCRLFYEDESLIIRMETIFKEVHGESNRWLNGWGDRVPADLHCHTKMSDGSVGIDELVQLAKRSGLSAIAVTDHDTFSGLACKKLWGSHRNGRAAGSRVFLHGPGDRP